jgi:hypothetical protein
VPIVRVQCSRCGLEATRIGYGDRAMTSVDAEVWLERCVAAAAARESGETPDPINVNCPHLQASADVREPASR